jgi:tRNA threonylcarbamoyladenosine biosynthesis protein TsaB
MRLALDTATDRLSVALGSTVRDAHSASLAGARRHAGAILPLVDTLLAERGAMRADIASVVLADGPGSFTGLRVGAAVAKALARAGKVDLYTAPSLLARAGNAARTGEVVVAVSDALRGEVYGGAWLWLESGIETLVPLAARRPEVLRDMVPRPDVVVGDVPAASADVLSGWAGRDATGIPPEAAWLLGLGRWNNALVRVLDPDTWEPQYGRPAEAQARWEAEHQRPLPDPAGQGR